LPTARAKGIGEGFLAVEAVGHLVVMVVCCVKVGFLGNLQGWCRYGAVIIYLSLYLNRQRCHADVRKHLIHI